jgi:hypothetical protein
MLFPKYNNPNIVRSTDKPSYLRNNDDTVSHDNFFKIVIVLDESGSMMSVKHQIIKSLNDLIMEQKAITERPTTFTLVKFNDHVNRVMSNKLLSDVHKLTLFDYNPNGSTALYDAIGDTITWFGQHRDLLLVIVTDGEENASTKYTKEQVNKMIDEKKNKNNWTYVYLSSDSNTEMQGNNMGLYKSSHASNCCVEQNNFGSFIGNSLNSAISGFRKKGISVQSQLP